MGSGLGIDPHATDDILHEPLGGGATMQWHHLG